MNTARAAVPVTWKERVRIFFLFTFALLALELVHDGYRWYAFGEERSQLRVLAAMVDSAGIAVIKTQLRTDSLRSRIEALDSDLEEMRDGFIAFDRVGAPEGPVATYGEYRSSVASYNRRVAERNVWFGEWQRALALNRDAVRQYNDLADQSRELAARMGEQHYNVPSPVEAAVRSGMRPD